MRKNLHKSNKGEKCPLEGQDKGLTLPSILLSQLGKPANSKREPSLAWTGGKTKWARS